MTTRSPFAGPLPVDTVGELREALALIDDDNIPIRWVSADGSDIRSLALDASEAYSEAAPSPFGHGPDREPYPNGEPAYLVFTDEEGR